MFTYTNDAGITFEKNRQDMMEFLRSGAGQTLFDRKDRDDWTIEVIASFTKITCNVVHKMYPVILDSATAELKK